MLYTVIRSCSNKRFELVFMFHSIIITSTFFSTSSRLWSRPYLTEMWMKWSYFCTRKMKSMHWYVPNGTILVSVNYVSHLHMWCNNFGQIVRVTGHIGCVGLKSQCWKEIKNLFFFYFLVSGPRAPHTSSCCCLARGRSNNGASHQRWYDLKQQCCFYW